MLLTRLLIACFLLSSLYSAAQGQRDRPISEDEKAWLYEMFSQIEERDQRYRSNLQWETLDEEILTTLDSIFDHEGVPAGLTYHQSLNLELPKAVSDSLWNLQHRLDLENHLLLRGIWQQYGYVPESVSKDLDFVQMLTLMHPPKDWSVENYLEEYKALFLPEVKAGRMPPIRYATFVDNIRGKILGLPQLYGTNQIFDQETGTVKDPVLEDLEASNAARAAIGLPPLE
ncbi:MAG: hypothetical protein AAFU60_15540 [Bacteroidota bacterium]